MVAGGNGVIVVVTRLQVNSDQQALFTLPSPDASIETDTARDFPRGWRTTRTKRAACAPCRRPRSAGWDAVGGREWNEDYSWETNRFVWELGFEVRVLLTVGLPGDPRGLSRSGRAAPARQREPPMTDYAQY